MAFENIVKMLCICAVIFLTFAGIQRAGATCLEALRTDHKLNCTAFCIEKFYDKLYCKAATSAGNLSSIIDNNSTESVLSHDYYASQYLNQLVINSDPRCQHSSDGKTAYYRPKELMSLLDGSPKDRALIDELNGNLTKRLDDNDKWCIETLHLDELLKKASSTGASPIVGSASNGSTIEVTSMQSVQTNASAASIAADSTTAGPIVDPSTKQGPQVRAKKHYVTAMLYIVIVVGVIAVVLSVCTGYACYLSKRRKRMAFSVYDDSSTTPLQLRVLQERDGITLEI